MSDNLTGKLEEFEQWRQDNLERLNELLGWLQKEELDTTNLKELIAGMRVRLLSETVKVAVVGEFSRGKSELLNAIFFAGSGRRILPVSVGRTTMCTVELGFDDKWPVGVRFLPLETRLQDKSLAEWRYLDDGSEDNAVWVCEEIDIDDPNELALALSKLGERRLVTPKEATDLGLWDEHNTENNPATNALGLIEIPKWRHAIVNFPHPLLKRGVTILDTPGLNAAGIEPELTLELLPQAHAVLFVLGADTGVTRSDLLIWDHYLSGTNIAERPCYVLLNKIDTLWDDLLSSDEIHEQLELQKRETAVQLNIPTSKVLAISAQKGLLGKIKGDAALIERSQIAQVERMLVRDILPQQEQILREVLSAGLATLHQQVGDRLGNQINVLDRQLDELQGVGSKNVDVAKQLTLRLIKQEESLNILRDRASKTRVLEKRMLRRIAKHMSHELIDAELSPLSIAISDPGMRVSLTKVFEQAVSGLQKRANKLETLTQEFEEQVNNNMQALEMRFGITLTVQPGPGIGSLLTDIEMLKNRHEAFFGVNQMLRLRRTQYAVQIYKTLLTRARSVFDEAYDMLEMWSNSSYSVLVIQVKDLEDSIQELKNGISRIREAKEPLNDCVDEMEDQRLGLFQQRSGFEKVMLAFEEFSEALRMHQKLSPTRSAKSEDAKEEEQEEAVEVHNEIESKPKEKELPEEIEAGMEPQNFKMEIPDFGLVEDKEPEGVKEEGAGESGEEAVEPESDFSQFNLPDSLSFQEDPEEEPEDKK